MPAIISASDVSRIFGTKQNPVTAVDEVNLEIEKGSFTVVLGKSGSGKSTLLNLLSGLDKPTHGQLIVDGKDLGKSSGSALAKYRSGIGIIFQFYNLLPNLNTVENVMMGAWAGGQEVKEEKALDIMKRFGVDHRAKADVKTLSGGEKQRVAICRSLVGDPEILFCDEPTGALDTANERQVMEIIQEIHQTGVTIFMVTHSPEFADYADKVVHMTDGKIEKVEEKQKQVA
jgi:putative ABC transport system ATP-binding protein